jgi:hypothetical protein
MPNTREHRIDIVRQPIKQAVDVTDGTMAAAYVATTRSNNIHLMSNDQHCLPSSNSRYSKIPDMISDTAPEPRK